MARSWTLLPLILLAGACEGPPPDRQFMPGADAGRGRALAQRVGCTSCHAIPGIAWPKGAVGPSLAGFADQTMISGRLPNRPDLLADFVRDAPATLPGSTMPAMPLSPQESRDVAAYLYTLGDR